MTSARTKTFLFLLLLNYSLTFAFQQEKDTIDQTEDQKLPSKDFIIQDSSASGENYLKSYKKTYYLSNRWSRG